MPKNWNKTKYMGGGNPSTRGRSRALAPLGSCDRRTDGNRLGPCANCGCHRWWDNRGARAAGQYSAADFRCTRCGYAMNESDSYVPWDPSIDASNITKLNQWGQVMA